MGNPHCLRVCKELSLRMLKREDYVNLRWSPNGLKFHDSDITVGLQLREFEEVRDGYAIYSIEPKD